MAKKDSRRSATHPRVRPSTSQLRPPSERTILTGLAGVFAVHVVGLLLIYSPAGGIFDGDPLIDQDWGLHFHHLKSLEAFWRQDGRLWGYNPYFMAGYPSNTIQDLSIKLFTLIALGLSTIALTPVQWFKLCSFLAMASVPWAMYCAGRNFFFDEERKNLAALAAASLGTIYWWNSLPREMFFYGMIGFPAASYLSILGVSLLYRLAAQSSSPPHSVPSGWLLFAASILPLHVQSVAIFLPAVAFMIVVQPRLLTLRLSLWLGLAGLLATVVNLPWLIAAIHHRGDDVSAAIVTQLPLFVSTHLLTFVLDYLGPEGYWSFRPAFAEKGFRLALLILGCIGLRRLIQDGKKTLGIMLAGTALVLFVVAYFGALVPALKPWQPLRFKVPLDLFLIVGAAYAAARWSAVATRSSSTPWILATGVIAFVVNVAQTESTGKLQLRSRPAPPLEAIVDWIAREAPPDARVLFEESGDETGFVYDGVYLSSFVPHRTGRELIGGPINLYNDRHHFAEFHSGKMFQKDLQTLSPENIAAYLRLYNIGAVVAFHPASVQRLQSMTGLITTEGRIGPVHLMKVHQQPNWFIEGGGTARAGFNRIELSGLTGAEVVLKYHWIEGLRSEPEVKIMPVKMADDPIPFIKLSDPPPSVVLRIGY